MPLELCCYLRSFSVTPQDRGGLFSYFLLSKKPLLLGFGNCTSSFPGYIGTKMLCDEEGEVSRLERMVPNLLQSSWFGP